MGHCSEKWFHKCYSQELMLNQTPFKGSSSGHLSASPVLLEGDTCFYRKKWTFVQRQPYISHCLGMRNTPLVYLCRPSTNQTSSCRQTDTIAKFKSQAKDTLKVVANVCLADAAECKAKANASTQALCTYCQQPQASSYILADALNVLATVTNKGIQT